MDIGICPENIIMENIFNKPRAHKLFFYRKKLIFKVHRMGVPQTLVRPPRIYHSQRKKKAGHIVN